MNTSDLYTRKDECTGCGLCAHACPSGIIQMEMDEEGFFYPSLSSPERCMNCQNCLRACPVKTDKEEASDFIGYYAGYVKDHDELTASSSGGLAAYIAQSFVASGGVVYGAAYSDDWHKVIYKRADHLKETEGFRSSKYIQAEKGSLFQDIEQDLKNNKKVLVFGVPCDIAAVKHQFGKYASLFAVEIICHGPTSPMVYDEYCTRLEREAGAKLTFFSCRYKEAGKWKPYYNDALFENGKERKELFQKSDYGVAFQCFKRPSCNHCVFKDSRLKGDLMLGDYHYAAPGMAEYHESGVSVILPHNEKGMTLIPFPSGDVNIFKVSPKSALMNRAIHEAIPARASRSLFYKKWQQRGLSAACHMRVLSIESRLIRGKNKIRQGLKRIKSLRKRQESL